MKKNIIVVVVFFFIICIILWLRQNTFVPVLTRQDTSLFSDYRTISVELGNDRYTLFVADDEEKRIKGLSKVPALQPHEGMIFTFPVADTYPFWMKEMKFDLDFIFINNNVIVDLKESISATSYPHTVTSSLPSHIIIELPAGSIQKSAITRKMRVVLPSAYTPEEIFDLVSVTDGDTIRAKNGTNDTIEVRYLGVDTPELPSATTPLWKSCYGSEARAYTNNLLVGKKMLFEYDVDRMDQYGRTLAYVYTLSPEGFRDEFVNAALIQSGMGRYFYGTVPMKYKERFIDGEQVAREEKTGLWGACGEAEYEYTCVIKGNVERSGARFYHLPGDRHYPATVVRRDREDQWLCTKKEAEGKGFKRARLNDQ